MILAWHRSNQTSKRLNCIPGVGPLLATALVASVADPKAFRSGRARVLFGYQPDPGREVALRQILQREQMSAFRGIAEVTGAHSNRRG